MNRLSYRYTFCHFKENLNFQNEHILSGGGKGENMTIWVQCSLFSLLLSGNLPET